MSDSAEPLNGELEPPEDEVEVIRDVGGRPRHDKTDERKQLVQVLHAHGISQTIICKAMGIDKKTLYKYYREELDEAVEAVEAMMGHCIVKAALNGTWGAAKYWLISHAKDPRWRTPETHQISGTPGGAPINMNVVLDMSEDDIRREIEDIERQQQISADAGALVPAMPRKFNGVGH